MIWLFIAGALPTLFRAWQDRAGATKQQKVWRNLAVYGASVLAAILIKPVLIVESILGLLTWRICAFDYVIHAFLKRFSKSHKKINIWTYTGKSTYWHDQLISRIPPWLRFGLRALVFAGALAWFIT